MKRFRSKPIKEPKQISERKTKEVKETKEKSIKKQKKQYKPILFNDKVIVIKEYENVFRELNIQVCHSWNESENESCNGSIK